MTEPEDVPRAFAAAWNARDAQALGACFAGDADFVNVVGLHWHNRRDIARAHGYALKRYFANTTLTMLETRVRRLGPAQAVVHIRWHLSGQTLPDGGTGADRETLMIMVLTLGEGGWRAVAAQNTDIAPGTQTMQARGGTLSATDYPR